MLSEKDKAIIEQITKLWGDITLPMLKIFSNDITPAHWIYAGYISGRRDAGKQSLINHIN